MNGKWQAAEDASQAADLSEIREAVEEIIAGEEVDRSTPTEVIAGIEAAMSEITHLRVMTRAQALTIFDLQERIDTIIAIGNEIEGAADSFAWQIVDKLTSGGSHAERNIDVLAAIRTIHVWMRSIKWDVHRVKTGRNDESFPPGTDMNDIPF